MSKTRQSLEYLRTITKQLPLLERIEAEQAIHQITERICGKLHIDEGEFATKPHHTHCCQHCGLTWRPAIGPTVGVQYLPGFKNESNPETVQLAAVKPPSWEPKYGSWARYVVSDSVVVQLGGFSKLTGRFVAKTVSGEMLYPTPGQLTRWIPRIDERVVVTNIGPGVVTSNGLDPGPEGMPFFLVKLDNRTNIWKAQLQEIEPAPPANETFLTKKWGFHPGDWVRVTKKGSELFGRPMRVLEVKTPSGVEWILLDGYPGLIDPAILERWKPLARERVLHKKSGAQRVASHTDSERNLFFLPDAIDGKHWFEASELEPYI